MDDDAAIGVLLVLLALGVSLAVFLAFSYAGLRNGQLDACEKTHNVYKCEWIAVPVEEE